MAEREPRRRDSRSVSRESILEDTGEIHGAFGTIRVSDVGPRRPWRQRLLTIVPMVITASWKFRRWERAMFVFRVASLLVLPLAIFSHPSPGAALHGLVVPGIDGGLTSAGALMILAIVGTTVAPWQLFFQQS